MEIKWNEVTWYSKIGAAAVMVAVLILGFYLGASYQKAINEIENQVYIPRTSSRPRVSPPPTQNDVPASVAKLCAGDGEQKIAAGTNSVAFRAKPQSALRCHHPAGEVWVVAEQETLPEAAKYYFNAKGDYIDMCQGLFAPKACATFKDVTCDKRDYCK